MPDTTAGRAKLQRVIRTLIAICVIQAGVAVFAAYTYFDQQSYQDCIARYFDASAKNNAQIRKAAEEVSDANDKFFFSVRDLIAGKDPKAVKLNEAVTDYIAAREEQDTERAQNPAPLAPSELCGGAP